MVDKRAVITASSARQEEEHRLLLSARLETWSNPMDRDGNNRILGMEALQLQEVLERSHNVVRVLRGAGKQKPTQKPCSSRCLAW
jgi:hypothetical protein